MLNTEGCDKIKILFLEPFYGGSHKDVALGFQSHSRHEVTLLTLPDRFWKWRMRGAALYFANQIENVSAYDLILVTDMMDLTDFKALMGSDMPPVAIYFHENQLSYPLAQGQKRDFHLGFTNIVSAFAADQVIFNSQFHFDAFIKSARKLIKQMPDFEPRWMLEQIKEKTQILYPGCQFDDGSVDQSIDPFSDSNSDKDIDRTSPETEPPLIIWNHRWEYDKCPEVFFEVLAAIKKENIAFSLAILGERPDSYPQMFDEAKESFKEQICAFGYADSRKAYFSWLSKGAIVVSCAIQENFGISVVEAVRHGCLPLLPNRLSYPEIMPEELHSKIIYRSKKELTLKLKHALLAPEEYMGIRRKLAKKMEKYSWQRMVPQYDALFERLLLKGKDDALC